MRTSLRLGPLPDTSSVKLTISLSAELKAQLDRYAELHAEAWGDKVEVATLIPHILQTFIARDRAFRHVLRQRAVSRPSTPGERT
jgi:hypothetical protein